MKILVSVLVFVTALTLGVKSLANEQAGHGDSEAGRKQAEERDMSTLFPQPKPDLSLGTRPEKPELEAPTFYQKVSDSKITLKWKGSAGAESYHVQVATDPNFKWLVKEEQLYKGDSLEVSGLEGSKHYFWRVAGLKPANKNGHIKGPFASSMFETTAK
jgi:hypothetical protein